MSYRKYLMADDVPPSELYKAVELSTNLAEVGTDCISRQAVKEILDKNQMPYHVYPYVWDAINALPPANTSEIPNSSDTISRAKAIDGKICIRRSNGVEIYDDYVVPVEYLEQLPPAQPEKLTDIEQRIFLAAMSKEEKVCREVDKEPSDADCINLMRVCKSIERKVKGALWT